MSATMRDSDLNELAKVFAASYESPHHITFTLDGLRNLITQAAQSQPAPPAPASVQEIMRLMMPYVSACGEFDDASTDKLEEAEARVAAAFAPLQAAITALVEKNHEMQFSLDGVNSTRPAPSMDTMQAIYAKAWMRAADWANRHDLHSDVGSPEYLKDMAIELAEFADAAMDGVNAMRRQEWISVDERLPAPGMIVLAFFRNSHGKARTVRAHHATKHTIEAGHWDEDCEVDETEDGTFEPEGWYEDPAVGETLFPIRDGLVTYWQPMPPPPSHGIEPEQGESHE